jgi:hypothetical protein
LTVLLLLLSANHSIRPPAVKEHIKEENRDLALKLTTMETTLADLRSQITVLRQANKARLTQSSIRADAAL